MIACESTASLPASLLQSTLSHGSIRAYGLMSLLPARDGKRWVSQSYLATQLKCSTRHVRNFLRELEQAEFLLNTGEFHGPHCVFRLLGGSVVNENTSEHAALPPEVSQSQATSLLTQNPQWKSEFSCFDGREGRPTLLQKITDALGRFQYGNVLSYVRYYLGQGAKWLIANLAKLHNVAPAPSSTSLEDLERDRLAQEAQRHAYMNRFVKSEVPEPSDDDRNFISAAFASLTAGFRDSN